MRSEKLNTLKLKYKWQPLFQKFHYTPELHYQNWTEHREIVLFVWESMIKVLAVSYPINLPWPYGVKPKLNSRSRRSRASSDADSSSSFSSSSFSFAPSIDSDPTDKKPAGLYICVWERERILVEIVYSCVRLCFSSDSV